jgi:hypothetical protein
MKAKLKKGQDGKFYLLDQDNKVTSHHHLSTKNCKKIEVASYKRLDKNNVDYIKLKLLNILLDNNINTDEVLEICRNFSKKLSKHIINSEQTEWDVEIVQEVVKENIGNLELSWYNAKLDENDCLILKPAE